MKTALISVFDKTGIVPFAKYLIQNQYQILSSGGTYQKLKNEIGSSEIYDIASYIDYPEILDGRVKTLHPKIHGGILAKRENQQHMQQLEELNNI